MKVATIIAAATAAGAIWRLHQSAFRDALPACGRRLSDPRRLVVAHRTLRAFRLGVARSRDCEH